MIGCIIASEVVPCTVWFVVRPRNPALSLIGRRTDNSRRDRVGHWVSAVTGVIVIG